jgi:hypothetical protein
MRVEEVIKQRNTINSYYLNYLGMVMLRESFVTYERGRVKGR